MEEAGEELQMAEQRRRRIGHSTAHTAAAGLLAIL